MRFDHVKIRIKKVQFWPWRHCSICSTTLTPRPPSLSEEWAPVRTTSYPWSCSWRPTRPPSSTVPSSSLTADILIRATVLEYVVFIIPTHIFLFNVMYVSINTICSYTWVLTICLFFWHPFLLCKRTCTHAHAHAYTKQTLHPILQSCKKIFWSAIDLPMWPIYNTIRANALVQLWCNFCESKWNPYWISMFMSSSSNNYFLSEHEDIDQYGPYVMPSERMLCNCYTVSSKWNSCWVIMLRTSLNPFKSLSYLQDHYRRTGFSRPNLHRNQLPKSYCVPALFAIS